MGVKIKRKGNLKSLINDINLGISKQKFNKSKKLIIKRITAGSSPVSGFGKYEKYSSQYANSKKNGKRTPVTLVDTGKMLKTLKFAPTSKGKIRIFFSSTIAKFHNTPGLARVLRKMLPSEPGLKFIPSIQKSINKEIEAVVSRATTKQNT